MKEKVIKTLSGIHKNDLPQMPIWRWQLLSMLRWIESRVSDSKENNKEKTNENLLPHSNHGLMLQPPNLGFSAAEVHGFDFENISGLFSQLEQNAIGCWGVNGSFSLDTTEEFQRSQNIDSHVREWLKLHTGVQSHFLWLFYRAWVSSQTDVNFDCWHTNRYRWCLNKLLGVIENDEFPAFTSHPSGDWMHEHLSVFGHHIRSSEKLELFLRHHLKIDVQVLPFVGNWMKLQLTDLTQLGMNSCLGNNAVLGSSVWGRQSSLQIVFKCDSWHAYCSLLPHQNQYLWLCDVLRVYAGMAFTWQMKCILPALAIPNMSLGSGKLVTGQTTWLNHHEPKLDTLNLGFHSVLGSV